MTLKLKKEKMNLLKLGLMAGFTLLGLNSEVKAQDAVEDKTAVSLYNDGLASLKAKDYATGLDNMESALVKAKEDNNEQVIALAIKNGAIAAYNLGNDYLKRDLTDSAKMTFDRGMAMNDKYGSLHLGEARVSEANGEIEKAMASYIMYGKLSKEEADVRREEDAYNRAKNMLIRQYNDKQYELITKIGAVYLENNNNPDVIYLVGKSFAELGNHKAAVENFDKSIEVYKTEGSAIDDKVYYALGESYEVLGDAPKAIEALGKITDEKYKTNAVYKIEKLSSN